MVKIEKVTEIYSVQFNGHTFYGTFAELEELCLALEEFLYDDPSYEKLLDKAERLESKANELEEKLKQQGIEQSALDEIRRRLMNEELINETLKGEGD